MRRIALVIALLLGPALPAHAADPETNKKVVLDFYEKGLNQKDFEAAAKHFGPRYIQHNPGAPDGIEGFKAFIAMRNVASQIGIATTALLGGILFERFGYSGVGILCTALTLVVVFLLKTRIQEPLGTRGAMRREEVV